MAYYYLGAQLPSLIYGQSAPMSSVAFKQLAQSSLKASDAVWLDKCAFNPEVIGAAEKNMPDFFVRWNEWEKALRFNLARFRAANLKRGISIDAPEYPADAVAAAKAASALDSPLEAELILDEARWKAIESFQGYDNFDRNAMYAYLLKLLLMERRSCFRAEEGFTEYKGLYAAVMEAAGSGFDGAVFKGQSGEPK